MLQETVVCVNGLQFFGHHGVTEEERSLGVQLVADISATVVLKRAPGFDEIGDTVSYIDLAQTLEAVSESQSFKTLEALIVTTAEAVFKQFSVVQDLTISIEKPSPPAPVTVDSVGVEMSFSRD